MGDYYDHTPEPVRCLVLSPYQNTGNKKQGLNGTLSTCGIDTDSEGSACFQHARSPEENLEEAVNLTRAIDLMVVNAYSVPVKTLNSNTLFGTGTVDRYGQIIEEEEIELAVVDFPLSPGQQRNLEKKWKCKVIDRTGLILEIFADRARTAEGKLQVELARLDYQKSRLVRAWTHLERQRSTGKTGGPGEKQIEIDKRLIAERITRLKKDLEKVEKTRSLQRKKRDDVPYPVVALVGYTNAGKSTLFNRLSGANVMVKDMLFATLDPTMREVLLPSGKKIILSDTVGFISNLPTQLVAAFKATLEEVVEADIILHVRDISSSATHSERKDVLSILEDMNVSEENESVIIEVLNKSDLLDSEEKEILQNQINTMDKTILCSALSGEGTEDLLNYIDRIIHAEDQTVQLVMPVIKGKAISWIHDNANVLSSETMNGGDSSLHMTIKARISQHKLGQFNTYFGDSDIKVIYE